ncbi:MAG: hypothetical protein JO174_03205 [Herbaspirillum sp.]|nr:hypothetical protein [Herbaspirillum sp.]
MLKAVKQRWIYLGGLFKENVGWQIIATLWVLWGIAAFYRDEIALLGDEPGFKVLNFILSISPVWQGMLVAAFLLAWLFESSYRMSQRQEIVLDELSKVDRNDLCRMLNGFYYQNTFYYKAEVTLCKRFQGKFEIEQLRDVYTEIEVRAPKYAWATIRLRWSNSDQLNAKYQFYIQDGNGNLHQIENIYEDLPVFLNDKSTFSLKLDWDERYVIEEHADLLVTISSWRK